MSRSICDADRAPWWQIQRHLCGDGIDADRRLKGFFVLRQDDIPQLIDIEVAHYSRISTGNDSNVWVVGDHVAKEYPRMSFDDAARYVALMNRAVEVIPRLGYSAAIMIDGVGHALTVVGAVPVERLGVSREGAPRSLSAFVDGPCLEKVMYPPQSYAEYARREIRDEGLRKFGAALNATFWSEYPTRVQDEFHYHVAMLSRRLDHELGVSGLYIGKYNAKLAPGPQPRSIAVTITDLAVYIDRIDYGD
jgi:hypothetical protein